MSSTLITGTEQEAFEAEAKENPKGYHGSHKDFIESAVSDLIRFTDESNELNKEKDAVYDLFFRKIHAIFYEWCLLIGVPKDKVLDLMEDKLSEKALKTFLNIYWRAFLNILRAEGITKKSRFKFFEGTLRVSL